MLNYFLDAQCDDPDFVPESTWDKTKSKNKVN